MQIVKDKIVFYMMDIIIKIFLIQFNKKQII